MKGREGKGKEAMFMVKCECISSCISLLLLFSV
jgi:hypothetical protein